MTDVESENQQPIKFNVRFSNFSQKDLVGWSILALVSEYKIAKT